MGGGYGGIPAAKALDDVADVADVTLVEPRETFVHNVAALRAAVDPAWTGGVSYVPELGFLGAEQTARFKATFLLERFEELLGVPAAA